MDTDVTDMLIALLKERREKGIAKYGRPLTTFNERDALRDALEEALDCCQYLLQAEAEAQAKVSWLSKAVKSEE